MQSSEMSGCRSASGSIERRVEDFLRKWYAWGPDFQVKVGPVKPSPAGNLYEVPIEVSAIEQKMPSPSPLQVFSLETLRAADVEIREAEAHLRAARSALSLTFAADAEQVRRS